VLPSAENRSSTANEVSRAYSLLLQGLVEGGSENNPGSEVREANQAPFYCEGNRGVSLAENPEVARRL